MHLIERTGLDLETPLATACECFHCGATADGDHKLQLEVDGVLRHMCCIGCKAVAEALIAAGHEDYYRVRSEPARKGQQLVPSVLREARVYDNPEVQSQFVEQGSDGLSETNLILEGITCAACLWMNERHLQSLPGVDAVKVNFSTRRAWLRWDEKRIKLSDILLEIESIGYHALPFDPGLQRQLRARERRRHLLGLGIAGLFGMQIMMLSISLYAGAWSGMEDQFLRLFRWLGLLLSLPIIGYSAIPFFTAAWSSLKNRRYGMDLPVSLALIIAFIASLKATLLHSGEVYFDSLAMFVFLLLLSRYFEMMAMQKSAETLEQLVHALPLMAIRLQGRKQTGESVSALSLQPGDRVLIRAGDVVPADGELIAGSSSLDESLLSGESRAQGKSPGDSLLGGSINLENPLQMQVQRVGKDTVLAGIKRMIEDAQADKPGFAGLADRIAARFVVAVLLLVSLVALFWWHYDPERWFEITLASLIVGCPCALSLATPASISAVMGKLQRQGLLIRRGTVLETLPLVTRVVFDKTGTLTLAQPKLVELVCAKDLHSNDCIRIAAALERHSEHPLAKALMRESGDAIGLAASELSNFPGFGICGRVNRQKYYVGSIEYILASTGLAAPADWMLRFDTADMSLVLLASEQQVMAIFGFRDKLREDAAALLHNLHASGYKLSLLSGDREAVVAGVAAVLGFEHYRAEMSPRQKMQQVRDFQLAGDIVLMVGDGINDAPVLAQADVSVAMAGASSLAKTSSDVVMLSERLSDISDLIGSAAKTRNVIRQNLGWALLYNSCAIPAAALGLVAPWLAAIGMSTSSLLVVANALRLRR